jgi:YHS domain-containing protein
MNNIIKKSFAAFTLVSLLFVSAVTQVQAGMQKTSGEHTTGIANSLVGVQGYDLVSYHEGGKPQRGNGNHLVEHHGITYQFVNEENKDKFAKDPHKYLPAYGGYCAYGVAVGKKFVGDPDVWKIVDNKLYLNLDNKIQGIWNKDISGNIQKAESHWTQIKNKKASDL